MTDHEALDRLRRALAAQADTVEVEARALEVIRDRITARRRRWWHGFRSPGGLMISIGTVAAGAVTASLIAVTGLVSCGPPAPPGPADSATPSVSVSPSASAEPSVTTPVVTATVPVYYAGTTDMPGQRYRLYREFQQAPAADATPGGRAAAAVTRMLTRGSAGDPDYQTLWPAGVSLRQASVDRGVVTVDLTGTAGTTPTGGLAVLALQQLVWTATAAGDTDVVRLLVDGQPMARLWGVDIGGELRRASGVDTLAPVWLIEPQHGATVGRTVQVHVSGYAHEGTVNLRVRNAAGAVVQETFVTLNRGAPDNGEARTTFTLAPGRYVVEAYVVSMEDGREMHRDTHGITVT